MKVQDQEEAKSGVSYMASFWREILMAQTKIWISRRAHVLEGPREGPVQGFDLPKIASNWSLCS